MRIIDQLQVHQPARPQRIDARLARRMGFTFEGLKSAIERGDIPAAKVGRSGGFYLAPETVERFTTRG